MKIQELNHAEMQQVNGGLLGFGGNSNNLLANLTNGLGLNLNFTRETAGNEHTGEYATASSFGLGLNLLSCLLGGTN
jgi:bacteriocin-like protein